MQVTRDGGKHWENVTPKDMPEWIQINSIDASPFDAGTAYVAATMYKSDDFPPVPLQDHRLRQDLDEDRQRHSGRITSPAWCAKIPIARACWSPAPNSASTFPSTAATLAVVPAQPAGGADHRPGVPKREDELVVATQGRAFWVLDDLGLLNEIRGQTPTEDVKLYKPRNTIRGEGGRGGGGGGRGGAAATTAASTFPAYCIPRLVKFDVFSGSLAANLVRKEDPS